MKSKKKRIFLFHRISPNQDGVSIPMHPDYFNRTIEYIKKKYAIISVKDLITQEPNTLSDKAQAAITFDDGYKDNLEYAAPILANHNCPASFYIISDAVKTGKPNWTHLIEYYFSKTEKKDISLELDSTKVFDLLSPQKTLEAVDYVWSWMRNQTNSAIIATMQNIESVFNDVHVPLNLMMNWGEIIELKNAGFEIGSHTVSHPMLATIKDKQILETELLQSKLEIEENLEIENIGLAYPVGSYNEEVKSLSKKVGYSYGLAVNQTSYKPLVHDHFEIPRIDLYSTDGWGKTKLRIKGFDEIKTKYLK